jgi:ferredoxin
MKKPMFLLLLALGVLLLLGFACKRVTITEYTIDSSSCNGCGECVRICPNDAVYLDHNGKAAIDQTKCTQCANCVAICPNSAIY